MNYMSLNEAARLNDLFAELRWHRYGLRAYPSHLPLEVAVQYKSDSRGRTRSVTCDPYKLETRIRKNRSSFGVVSKLTALLDRKSESNTAPAQQPTLFSTAELAPTVKRSMNPNEQ